MADADLEEIRKARLAQLRQQQQASSPSDDQAEQQREREADARASILAQILLPDAADRLGRIRLVNEARATDVENRLIMLARSGQLRQKVTEEQLKDLLGAVSSQQEEQQQKIVVQRRAAWDEDEELNALMEQ